VLRDNRFTTAKGLGLDAQGITSGPLWDRAINNILSFDGAKHHRLRRLVSKAFGPNVRRTGSAPWEAISGITGPTTPPLEFDVRQ
jgi:cytochrome P450